MRREKAYIVVNKNCSMLSNFLGRIGYMPIEYFKQEINRCSFLNKTNNYELMSVLLENCIDKNILEFETIPDKYHIYNRYCSSLADKDAMDKHYFEDRKIFLSDNNVKVYDLYQFLRPIIRKFLIANYFKQNIRPTVSEHIFNLCTQNSASWNHIEYSNSFIGSYKLDLLGKYQNQELYWIRLLYCKESEQLIEDNFGYYRTRLMNKNLKVFLPTQQMQLDKDQKIKYIDIFTTDHITPNFLRLAGDNKLIGFIADLTQLVTQLDDFDLLNL